MESKEKATFVSTNPRIPAALGTLNVIFGVILLIYGVGSVAWTILSPMLSEYITTEVRTARHKDRAAQQARLADLKKSEQAEATPAKKAELQAEVVALQNEIDLEIESGEPAADNSGEDLRIAIAAWVETILGIALSLLMIISGADLMALRHRGRTLALWVALVKLVWLAVSMAYALLVTIPIAAELMRDQFAKLEAQAGPGIGSSAGEVAVWGAASAAVFTVAGTIISAIYPAITIWLLNKKTVKAAFLVLLPMEKPRSSSLSNSGSTQ